MENAHTLPQKPRFGYGVPPPGYGKRTVEKFIRAGKIFFTPQDFLKIIREYSGDNYSDYNSPSKNTELIRRDKALISFYVLSCARLNEGLKITRGQISLKDPEWIIIHNFVISKRKKGRLEFLGELPLTRKPDAVLFPFTEMFLAHVETVKRGKDKLFNIGTRRARQIITSMHTDLFPHFIRGCSLSYFINTLRNPIAVSRIFGVKDTRTLLHYYGKTWEDYRGELSA